MVRDCPQISAQLWSQENGKGTPTNISIVMITRECWGTIHIYQHSFDQKKMVRDCPQISAQLWSQENGKGTPTNISKVVITRKWWRTIQQHSTVTITFPQTCHQKQKRYWWSQHTSGKTKCPTLQLLSQTPFYRVNSNAVCYIYRKLAEQQIWS